MYIKSATATNLNPYFENTVLPLSMLHGEASPVLELPDPKHCGDIGVI
jgi:hypothetical protein